jgi:hypothetical protein
MCCASLASVTYTCDRDGTNATSEGPLARVGWITMSGLAEWGPDKRFGKHNRRRFRGRCLREHHRRVGARLGVARCRRCHWSNRGDRDFTRAWSQPARRMPHEALHCRLKLICSQELIEGWRLFERSRRGLESALYFVHLNPELIGVVECRHTGMHYGFPLTGVVVSYWGAVLRGAADDAPACSLPRAGLLTALSRQRSEAAFLPIPAGRRPAP